MRNQGLLHRVFLGDGRPTALPIRRLAPRDSPLKLLFPITGRLLLLYDVDSWSDELRLPFQVRRWRPCFLLLCLHPLPCFKVLHAFFHLLLPDRGIVDFLSFTDIQEFLNCLLRRIFLLALPLSLKQLECALLPKHFEESLIFFCILFLLHVVNIIFKQPRFIKLFLPLTCWLLTFVCRCN